MLWPLLLLPALHFAEAARPGIVEVAAVQPHGMLVRQRRGHHSAGAEAADRDKKADLVKLSDQPNLSAEANEESQLAAREQAAKARLADELGRLQEQRDKLSKKKAQLQKRRAAVDQLQAAAQDVQQTVKASPPGELDFSSGGARGSHQVSTEEDEQLMDDAAETEASPSGEQEVSHEFSSGGLRGGHQITDAPPSAEHEFESGGHRGGHQVTPASPSDEHEFVSGGPRGGHQVTEDLRGKKEDKEEDAEGDEEDVHKEPAVAIAEPFQTIDSSPPVKKRDLFKATAATDKNLREAARGIDHKLLHVDQAIDKIHGAMDKYHQSINGLSDSFGSLRKMAVGMHVGLNGELQERERKRLCSFENLDRMMKGLPYAPCGDESPLLDSETDGRRAGMWPTDNGVDGRPWLTTVSEEKESGGLYKDRVLHEESQVDDKGTHEDEQAFAHNGRPVGDTLEEKVNNLAEKVVTLEEKGELNSAKSAAGNTHNEENQNGHADDEPDFIHNAQAPVGDPPETADKLASADEPEGTDEASPSDEFNFTSGGHRGGHHVGQVSTVTVMLPGNRRNPLQIQYEPGTLIKELKEKIHELEPRLPVDRLKLLLAGSGKTLSDDMLVESLEKGKAITVLTHASTVKP